MAKSLKSAGRDVKHLPPRYTDEPSVAGNPSSAIPLFNHLGGNMRDPTEVLPGYRDEESDMDEESHRYEVGDRDEVGNRDEESEGEDPPPFTVYRPVVKKIKSGFGMGDTLTVSHDQHLNNDGEALYRWLKEESLTPPKPQVHIKGTHQTRRRKDDKTETSTTTDFELRLSLGEYLLEGKVPGFAPHLKSVDQDKKTNRGGRWKTVATGLEAAQLSVRDWADQYCEDESTLKEFVMKKSCEGWDLSLLQDQLYQLIRSTNYLGRIEVNFPVFETRVEVFPSNRISRMRKNTYWRWFFYLTFLWIFTWPYLWFFTKRYHVAETIWHYSAVPRRLTPGGPQRIFVHDEDEWLMAWGPAIKRAARSRRRGFVTAHDIDEMESEERRSRIVRPLARTGNSTIDSVWGFAAGAVADGMRFSRSEATDWGGDDGC